MNGTPDFTALIPDAKPELGYRTARVISVDGNKLTVDMGGPITVLSLDSCNPVPDQNVALISVGGGTGMLAIGTMGGPARQSVLTVTATTSTTVTGLLNGVSKAIPKAGTYTPVVGDKLPLVWSADGSNVWALEKGGVDPVTPPPSGGGGTPLPSGGGTVQTGTATYTATAADTYSSTYSKWVNNGLVVQGSGTMRGCWFYGSGRFRELQGRTITGFRINVARQAGDGSPSYYTHGYAAKPAGSPALSNGPVTIGGAGWISLPVSMANWLIGGSGTGGIGISGVPLAGLKGVPYGTLQFDWMK